MRFSFTYSFSSSESSHYSNFWNIPRDPASEPNRPAPGTPAPIWWVHVHSMFPSSPPKKLPLEKKPPIFSPQLGGKGGTESNLLQAHRLQSAHLTAYTSILELVFVLGCRARPSHTGSLPGSVFILGVAPQAGSPPFDLSALGCYKYACIKLSPAGLRASVWNASVGLQARVPFRLHSFWQAG